MPRKYTSTERFLKPDTKYGSKLVTKFINYLMHDGKKTKAETSFYAALEEISRQVPDTEPLKIFEAAIGNVKPLIEVRSKRVGGSTYQVPKEVKRGRQQSLAIRWILSAVRAKKGRPTWKALSDELLDAYRKQGAAMQVRENVHRMAEANRAFSHLSW